MPGKQEQARKLRQGDLLYRRYGQPLEAEHRGQYVAIALDGKTVLADTPLEAMQKAKEVLGPGNFLFKVGDKVVWALR